MSRRSRLPVRRALDAWRTLPQPRRQSRGPTRTQGLPRPSSPVRARPYKVRLHRKRFGWTPAWRPWALTGAYRFQTFSLIFWAASPVFSAAFSTAGFTAAIVLSAASLATFTVVSAGGRTAFATSLVAWTVASAIGLSALATSCTAGRTVLTALSTTGSSSFAARFSAAAPVSTARSTAFSAVRRSRSISLRGAPQAGQTAAPTGNSAPQFGQFIPSPMSLHGHRLFVFRWLTGGFEA